MELGALNASVHEPCSRSFDLSTTQIPCISGLQSCRLPLTRVRVACQLASIAGEPKSVAQEIFMTTLHDLPTPITPDPADLPIEPDEGPGTPPLEEPGEPPIPVKV